MRGLTLTCVLVLSLIVLLNGTGAAYIASPVELARNANEADAAFVGSVLDTSYGPEDKDRVCDITMKFLVDRILKGDAQPGTVIEIRWRAVKFYPQHLLSGYDLVLLNTAEGGYTFARQYFSSLPVSRIALSQYTQSSDVRANLRWEMLNSLQDSSWAVMREALQQTSLLSRDDASTYLLPRTNASDIRTRALALKACIALGRVDLIAPALELVQDHLPVATAEERSDLVDLQNTLMVTKLKPEHFGILANGLASQSQEVREFASYILRRSQNQAAVGHLKKALQDSDIRVRYNAVMGLSAITKDFINGPAYRRYAEAEQRYLIYWKAKALPSD